MEENNNKSILASVRAFFKKVGGWFMRVFRRIGAFFKGLFTKKEGYLSRKDEKRIAKENFRATRALERQKKRKRPESEYLTEMRDENNIVEFDDLHTYFFTDAGTVKAVNGVSFDVPRGSTVGIVGESGCGKSVTSLSLMQLVQAPQGQIVSGSIRFKANLYETDERGKKIPIYAEQTGEDGEILLGPDGKPRILTDEKGKPVQKRDEAGVPLFRTVEKTLDIAKMPARDMCKVRGKEISMIFQEPMTSLNPIFTIGNQLDEVTLLHVTGATRQAAKAKSIEMLKLVGIAMPEDVYKRYPHELSGGMRQRVMIAMALACNPKLIIADEPTTALDVTIQAQILDLLREIKNKISGSIMLITHDLGVIAEMADYVVVMYAGRIVEKGTVEEIFDRPLHPYTIGLQKSKPVVTSEDTGPLFSIPGNVPNPINMPQHCYFYGRCDKCDARCRGEYPPEIQVSPTHSVSCYLYDERRGE